jgi:hypothetical protein
MGAARGAVGPRLGRRWLVRTPDALIWRWARLFVVIGSAEAMPVSLPGWLQVRVHAGTSPSSSPRYGARLSVFADAKRHLVTRTTPSTREGAVTPNLDACARFLVSTSRGDRGLSNEPSDGL